MWSSNLKIPLTIPLILDIYTVHRSQWFKTILLMLSTQWTFSNIIIGWGWAKYRDLSVASRIIICRCRRQRQIIVCETLTKSQYVAKTEFNNYCFIIHVIFSHLKQQLWKNQAAIVEENENTQFVGSYLQWRSRLSTNENPGENNAKDQYKYMRLR